MKKIIIVLSLFLSLPVGAEIAFIGKKNDPNNNLFVDQKGHYRYLRGIDVYQKECKDIWVDTTRDRCLESERAAWERNKTPEDLKKEGTLFTGKIRVPSSKEGDIYFYVENGVKGNKIRLLLNRFYFEKGSNNKDTLFDIKTEEPYTGDVTIGTVDGLSAIQGSEEHFIVQQNYKKGLPNGKPKLLPADEKNK